MLCLTRKRAVFLVSKSPKPSYFCNSNFQGREVCKPAERKPGHLCQRECPLQQAEATKVGDGPPRSNSASDSRAKHASGGSPTQWSLCWLHPWKGITKRTRVLLWAQCTDLPADPVWSQACGVAGQLLRFHRKPDFLSYLRCEKNHWPIRECLHTLWNLEADQRRWGVQREQATIKIKFKKSRVRWSQISSNLPVMLSFFLKAQNDVTPRDVTEIQHSGFQRVPCSS